MSSAENISPAASGTSSAGDLAHTNRQESVSKKPERFTYTPAEAAASLGVSRDFFDKRILIELRVIRRGSRILVPLTELTRWVDHNAAYTIERNHK
jgi:hypothetical protein